MQIKLTEAHLKAIRWKLGILISPNIDEYSKCWDEIRNHEHFPVIAARLDEKVKEAFEELTGIKKKNVTSPPKTPAMRSPSPKGTGLYGGPGNPATTANLHPATTAAPPHPASPTLPIAEEPPVLTQSPPPPPLPPPAKWKYLPVASPLEPHTDSEHSSLENTPEGWNAIGARARGRKHKLDGTNCDDAYDFRQVGSWTLIAVSDGAGSKKYSRIGAKVATTSAVENLATYFSANEPILRTTREEWEKFDQSSGDGDDVRHAIIEAVQAARRAISDAVADRTNRPEFAAEIGRQIDDQDFSCTLLVAAVREISMDGISKYLVAISQVGDGMIGAIDRTGGAHVLGVADSGGHAGETEFLTSDGKATAEFLLTKTRVHILDLQALLVMTDGVADDYFPGITELQRLWGDLLTNGIPQIEPVPNVNPKSLPYGFGVVIDTIEANPRTITLQSSEALAKYLSCSIPEILKSPEYSLLKKAIPGETAQERLCLWIDAYQVRGSFDDRTLVVFHRRNLV